MEIKLDWKISAIQNLKYVYKVLPTKRVCNFAFTFTTLKIFAIQVLKSQGATYGACTQAGSENGAAWCATEVDENGEVVRNTWEDCDLACPQEGTVPA